MAAKMSDPGDLEVINTRKYSKEFENSLNERDRLGLAFCRLNFWEWDDLVGKKPEGFDDLPMDLPRSLLPFRKKKECKAKYIGPAIAKIESILTEEETSWYHWRFVRERTWEEWLAWYFTEEKRLRR